MRGREHQPIAYIAPLDGIRAIAIIAVLVFHVHPGALKGGFTGVDVFYVLSGFLITRIILQDLRTDRFSFGEFYLRRIQRLLPNVMLTVLVTLAAWMLVMMPSQVVQVARHGLWALFNLSNIYTWIHLGDYWGDAAEWAPLTHTWSLGVEEQFYLLYPASLILLAKFQPRRMQTWLVAAGVVSFAAGVVVTWTHPIAAFYLLPTRLWELLLGCVLALRTPQLVLREESVLRTEEKGKTLPSVQRKWEYCGLGGLALVMAGFVLIDSSRGFPGYVSLVPTVGTAMLVLAVTRGGADNWLVRWLASPFMVFTGKLSYSLYLWHWPAITLGKYLAHTHGFPPLLGGSLGGVVGVGLAWGAYILVEQPLRARGAGRVRRLATIASSFALVILFAWVVSRQGVAGGVAQTFHQPAFHGKFYDTDLRTSGNPTAAVRYADVYFPPMVPRPDALWKTGGVVRLYGASQPQIVVLGSSHALMHARLIDDICREKSLSVAFLTAGGRSLFFDEAPPDGAARPAEPDPFDVARRRFLRTWRPEAIIAIDRWDARFEQPLGFEGRLRAFLEELAPLSGRILFVAQVPVAEYGEKENLREVVAQLMKSSGGALLPRLAVDAGEPLRREAVATAEALTLEYPGFRVLRVDRMFYQRDGSIQYAEGRHFYYADDDHLSDLGSERARGLFTEAIMEAHEASAARR